MRDYKFKRFDDPIKRPKRNRIPWIVLMFVPVAIIGVLGFGSESRGTDQHSTAPTSNPLNIESAPDSTPESVTLTLPTYRDVTPTSTAVTATEQDTPEFEWRSLVVKSGDTLAALFQRHGLSAAELQRLMLSGEDAKELTRIYPGDEIKIATNSDGRLKKLVYQKVPTRILNIERHNDEFVTQIIEKAYEKRLARATGIIEDSLFAAATQAGLSERLTMELASIFGWDIDFALDIRSGDRFSLVYEELYLDGEKVEEGRIVAAEFVNQGREVRAILFTKPTGVSDYFSPDGHSMRKAFLRSPVDFRRISSRFQGERWHPVLGKKRPHRGVDYAASIGTPIKAAGDGKIIFAGNKGGYGQTVVVQHGQSYSTLYAHMSRIARGMRPGKRIQQGQTIGYVGRTGLATGPHLHYEFLVNGVHRNPLTIKLPQAQPLESEYREAFEQHASELLAQLDLLRRFAVAQADAKP